MIENPFPLLIEAKVNSPSLEAYFLQFGETTYIGAQNFNKMIQALNYLYENIGEGGGESWEQQPTDWDATEGVTRLLNKPEDFKFKVVALNSDALSGEFNTTSIKNYVNALAPFIVAKGELVFFVVQDTARFFVFVRGAGTYGAGQTQTVAGNFFLMPAITYSIPALSQVLLAGALATLGIRFADGGSTYPAVFIDKQNVTAENWNNNNFEQLQLISNILRFSKTYYPGGSTHKTEIGFEDPTTDAVFLIPNENDIAAGRDWVQTNFSSTLPGDVVGNIAARDAYDVPVIPFILLVLDDGDTKWALYMATTTGVAATFIKISDPDLLNAQLTDAAIKTAYENNANTNAYTTADKNKVAGIASGATANDSDSNLKNRANHTGSQTASTISDFDASAKAAAVQNNLAAATDKAPSATVLIAALSAKVKTVFKQTDAGSALTGVTTEGILATIAITAAEFALLDQMQIFGATAKTGSTGTYTLRLRINTSNSLSGAVQIASAGGTAAALSNFIKRTFGFRTGNLLEGYPFTQSSNSDDSLLSTLARSTTSLDPSTTFYIFLTGQLVSSTDSLVCSSLSLLKI